MSHSLSMVLYRFKSRPDKVAAQTVVKSPVMQPIQVDTEHSSVIMRTYGWGDSP